MRIRTVFAVSAVVFAVAASHPAAAQQAPSTDHVDAAVFTIIAGYAPDENQLVVQDARVLQGTLTAKVDGLDCATIDITPTGDVPLYLGTSSQPEACGRSGAEVILYNQYDNEMFVRFVIEPGATATLTNYAVAPVSDGPSDGPSAAASGNAGMASPRGSTSAASAFALIAALIAMLAVIRRSMRSEPDC